MITGLTTRPMSNPSFVHTLFNGRNDTGWKTATTKNKLLKASAHQRTGWWARNGERPTSARKMERTIPKPRSEEPWPSCFRSNRPNGPADPRKADVAFVRSTAGQVDPIDFRRCRALSRLRVMATSARAEP